MTTPYQQEVEQEKFAQLPTLSNSQINPAENGENFNEVDLKKEEEASSVQSSGHNDIVEEDFIYDIKVS